jgi:hypothetical protein
VRLGFSSKRARGGLGSRPRCVDRSVGPGASRTGRGLVESSVLLRRACVLGVGFAFGTSEDGWEFCSGVAAIF